MILCAVSLVQEAAREPEISVTGDIRGEADATEDRKRNDRVKEEAGKMERRV